MNWKYLGLGCLAVFAAMYWQYCQVHRHKLAEMVFLKNENFELKLVTRYESIPLHYVGEVYSVACRTNNTSIFQAWPFDFVEAGWNLIPAITMPRESGSRIHYDLERMTALAKKAYLPLGPEILAVKSETRFSISFDGCRQFTYWDFKHLPADLAVQNSKETEACLAQQKSDKEKGLQVYGDCKVQNFLGERAFEFTDIQSSNAGQVSFLVHSAAFPNGTVLKVSTKDSGATWQTEIGGH